MILKIEKARSRIIEEINKLRDPCKKTIKQAELSGLCTSYYFEQKGKLEGLNKAIRIIEDFL